MNLVKPFKAIRPKKNLTATFVSQPFDFYTSNEIDLFLHKKPNSFLKIIRPKKNSSLLDKKNQFNKFLQKSILIKDERKSYYIYSQIIEKKEYTGIICATNTSTISKGILKTHEKTLLKKEHKLKDYLKTVDINAEPVSLVYKDNHKLSSIINKIKALKENLIFTTNNNATHKLWIVNNYDLVNKITCILNKLNSFYIADGHHRSAASFRLAKELQKEESHNSHYFLSIFFNEKDISVHSFNRIILLKKKSKNIIELLKEKFTVFKKMSYAQTALNKKEIGMYIDNQWYNLIPKSNTNLTGSETLDAKILPLLNLNAQSKEIQYISNIKGGFFLEEKAKEHKSIAFKLHPITFNDVILTSDKGKTLPPKSTWIEPKLLSGLTIFDLEINE